MESVWEIHVVPSTLLLTIPGSSSPSAKCFDSTFPKRRNNTVRIDEKSQTDYGAYSQSNNQNTKSAQLCVLIKLEPH